jgi:hypothetical protein
MPKLGHKLPPLNENVEVPQFKKDRKEIIW